MAEILVVDDNVGEFSRALSQALSGHVLHFASCGSKGLAILGSRPNIALVLLDVVMPRELADIDEREGLAVLCAIREARPDVPVVMLSALSDIDVVVEAVKSGAFHYITKPFERDRLREEVGRALETAVLREKVQSFTRARDALVTINRGEPAHRSSFHGMVGAHPLIQDLFSRIERLGQFDDVSVLILGERGTGKELVARAIHECSGRSKGPFVSLNCAALTESLVESELFGYEKGAFSGAEHQHIGLFEEADGGTFFLDEIGDMSPALQSKLLRAIEYKEIKRIGNNQTIQVDVRFLSATNRDLAEAKAKGEFREDLYDRVSDIPLPLPTLRERPDDIPLLVDHFLRIIGKQYDLLCSMEPDATATMMAYGWPGNVRQLYSTLRRLVVLSSNQQISGQEVAQTLGIDLVASGKKGIETYAAAPRVHESVGESPVPEPNEAEPSLSVAQDGEQADATPEPTEEFPEIADLAVYARRYGKLELGEHISRALAAAGTVKGAMALLGVPEDKYAAFRKWLQRLEISARDVGRGRGD